jgi:tetratricopeptide (TPR) repeat protein
LAKRNQNDQHKQPDAGGGAEPARKSREYVLKPGGKPTAGRKPTPAASGTKPAAAHEVKGHAKTPPNDRASSNRRLIRDLKVGLAIALLVGAIYATYRESNAGRLFFDDHSAIENNPNVRAFVNPTTRWKLATWLKACSSDVETPLSGRPVASLSFALNHWWASAMHPSLKAGYDGLLPVHTPYFHYVNLAIHMLVAILLFLLVRRTLNAPNLGDAHRSTADLWGFFVALVWAVHPLNTETVVYVTQRTEQLVSLFLLLTLYYSARAYDATSPKRRIGWYIGAVAACLLGMGSKENMIAAPLLVVAYDRAFNYPDWRSALKARRWFYLPIAATWIALGFILTTNPRGLSVGFHDARLPWYEYLITQCWCLWRYFWLTIVPLGGKLCVDYGRRPVLEFHHTAPGALLVFSLLGLTIWGWVRKPWLGFLGVWFFFILAPTSSFYPIITEVGAERRMYLPSAAILIGLMVGIVALVGRLRSSVASGDAAASVEATVALSTTSRTDRFTRGALCLALVPIAWLAYTSHQRNRVYQDDLTLYKHIVDVFPDNDRGCNNYGSTCLGRGMVDEALNLFNRSIKIDPEYTDALTNRAVVFLGQEWNPGSARTDLSIADSTEALNWQWYGYNALNNRATAYMDAKQYDRAEADFAMLLKLNPLSPDAKFNQALFLSKRGDDEPKYLDDALIAIDEALRLSPDSYRAHNARGDILSKLKRYDEAIVAFRRALDAIHIDSKQWPPESEAYRSWKAAETALPQITATNRTVDPKLSQSVSEFPQRAVMAAVYGNLGVCYERAAATKNDKRYHGLALDALSKAVFLDGGNPRYYTLRGDIFLKSNRFGEAIYDFDAVLQRNRYFPDALLGRLQTYARTGNYAAARADALTLQRLRVPLDAEKTALIADVLAKSATP